MRPVISVPEKGYRQGGYEAGQASAVTPEVEKILMKAMRKLLGNRYD